MLAAVGRGALIRAAVATTSMAVPLPVTASWLMERATALTLEQALALVRRECDPAFLDAVRAAGGSFLYRGEAVSACARLAPRPDLLALDTYGSACARAYFERLDRELRTANAPARPSSGHIAVGRVEAAAVWGDAVSVWPLGRALHYVWPTARDDFWPASVTSSSAAADVCGADAVERLGGVEACTVDAGLVDALRLGREVLFASAAGAAFVAIPSSADADVRRRLLLEPS